MRKPKATRQQVAEFAQAWLERKRHEIGTTTVDRYASTLELHLVPYLGELYFDAVGREDVQAWASARLAEGYKVTTVKSWLPR